MNGWYWRLRWQQSAGRTRRWQVLLLYQNFIVCFLWYLFSLSIGEESRIFYFNIIATGSDVSKPPPPPTWHSRHSQEKKIQPGIFFCEIAHYEFPFPFHPQIPGIRFSIPLPLRNRPSHSCSRSQDQKDIPVHPCFQCWIKTTFPSVGTERVVRLILGSQRNFAITASASHQLFSCCWFSTAIWIYKS